MHRARWVEDKDQEAILQMIHVIGAVMNEKLKYTYRTTDIYDNRLQLVAIESRD